MVLTPSTMLELDTPAPDFSLPGVDGKTVSLADFSGKPLLLFFTCNHCPFVKHIREHLAATCTQYQEKGVGVVAISANDAVAFPDDSPEKMAEEAETFGYTFPYLYDASQEVAKAYRAACTPDFYVFDAGHKLVYRGQYDDSRPESDVAVNGADLRGALDAVLAGARCSSDQKPATGCNIKWKPGNNPDYFSG